MVSLIISKALLARPPRQPPTHPPTLHARHKARRAARREGGGRGRDRAGGGGRAMGPEELRRGAAAEAAAARGRGAAGGAAAGACCRPTGRRGRRRHPRGGPGALGRGREGACDRQFASVSARPSRRTAEGCTRRGDGRPADVRRPPLASLARLSPGAPNGPGAPSTARSARAQVVLYESYASQKAVLVKPGARFQNRYGVFELGSLVGERYGGRIFDNKGKGFVHVLRATSSCGRCCRTARRFCTTQTFGGARGARAAAGERGRGERHRLAGHDSPLRGAARRGAHVRVQPGPRGPRAPSSRRMASRTW